MDSLIGLLVAERLKLSERLAQVAKVLPAHVRIPREWADRQDQDGADSLALMLQRFGHEVRTVYDGHEAVREAEAFQPDVALLDLGMPGMSGFETARRIRAIPGGDAMTLIAVTGWGQERDRQRTAAAGFDAHIVKPVDPLALQALLGRSRSD